MEEVTDPGLIAQLETPQTTINKGRMPGAKAGPDINPEAVAAAKNKLVALMALNNQVRRSAQQFDANFNGKGGEARALGSFTEYLPAFMNDKNDSYDATVAGMAPLARAAFRTPGQGADSDRDVGLFMGMMPGRYKTDAGNLQRYKQMSQMILDNINGQRQILGMGPMPTGKKAAKGARASSGKVIDFNELDD